MLGRDPGSLRLRLLALVAAVGVPLLGVLTWGFVAEVEREHGDARNLALRIARAYAEELRDANRQSEELLARMSSRPKIRNADPAQCDSLFAIVDFFPHYKTLLLYDNSHQLLCSSTPHPADVATATGAESEARKALASLSLAPAPIVRRINAEWVMITFRPVVYRGTRTGTLALVETFEIGTGSYPEGTVVTIADREGRVVARSVRAERWLGRNIGTTELVKIAQSEGEGRLEARGIDGHLRQYGYTAVANLGWQVFVGVPADVAMAQVRSLLARGAMAGIVVLVLVTLLAMRISRTIEQPLETLATAVQKTADEGFGVRVPADGPRETRIVADAFNRMVDSRADAEAALVDSRARLQELSERLLEIQEQERSRLSREVHDQLGQALTALKMDVGGLLRAWEPRSPQQAEMRERVRVTLDELIETVQRISAELRPGMLDDFGLCATIQSDVRAFEERTGIECDVSVPEHDIPLDNETEVAVYRIFQEAMTNVARHSDATRVEIRLRTRGGEMLLDVRDDGRGITDKELTARESLGLAGMRERARLVGAKLELEGVEGRGTIVSLRVPLDTNERSYT